MRKLETVHCCRALCESEQGQSAQSPNLLVDLQANDNGGGKAGRSDGNCSKRFSSVLVVGVEVSTASHRVCDAIAELLDVDSLRTQEVGRLESRRGSYTVIIKASLGELHSQKVPPPSALDAAKCRRSGARGAERVSNR